MERVKKGFTLIEMLVAVVVVGMIVGTLIGIFGNPMGEASLESSIATVKDHYRIISDAENFHYAFFGKWANKQELIESGTLKSWPTPPPMAEDRTGTGCLETWGLTEYGYHILLPPDIPENKDYAILFPCPASKFHEAYESSGN